MPDFKAIAKQLDEATKELAKERQAWRVKVGEQQRKHIQLTAVNADLKAKNDTLAKKEAALQTAIIAAETALGQLRADTLALETKADMLETKVADKADELATLRTDIASQKAKTSRELEDYATNKKLEVKQAILLANEELLADRAEVQVLQDQIDTKTNQLAELNQAAMDEQEAVKLAEADKQHILDSNVALKAKLIADTQQLQDDYDHLGFEYNNAQITVKKAQEDHDKFLDYERRARKVLENKDRELQDKEAELGQQGMFMKNRRSNLTEL